MIRPKINIEAKDEPCTTPICPFAQTLPVVPICVFSQHQTPSQLKLAFYFNDDRGFDLTLVEHNGLLPLGSQKQHLKLEHPSKPNVSKGRPRTLSELPDIDFGESISSPDPLTLESRSRLRPRLDNRHSPTVPEGKVVKRKKKTIGCPHCPRKFTTKSARALHLKSLQRR